MFQCVRCRIVIITKHNLKQNLFIPKKLKFEKGTHTFIPSAFTLAQLTILVKYGSQDYGTKCLTKFFNFYFEVMFGFGDNFK